MNLYHTDCETLWSQMKRQEKELKRKRRWLMGLPTSKSEEKQLRVPSFLENRSLPESLLREDDVFYETIKRCVEEAYGECAIEMGHHVLEDNIQVVGMPSISGVMSRLDDMTNKGLYHIAMILTGGSVKLEKTRWGMTKVIRESVSKIAKNHNPNDPNECSLEISRKLSQVLNNSHYFCQKRRSFCTSASHSQQAAVKILDQLEDLPFQTLIEMHRKMKGVQGGIPQLVRRRSGWNRDRLINQVRKTCDKMLSKLGEGDELQEPLAKAMEVARLSLKLTRGFQNPNVTEFHQLSPEIVSLQNEIAKAIWLVKKKVRYPELKNLILLLDPGAKIASGCLRTAIKNLLTEYLFDCNDLDTIPKSLSKTLAIINRTSLSIPYRCFPKEEIEKEVECILSVSAQARQIVLDLLPDHEFDQDFSNTYMEDLEDSDDGDSDGYNDDDDDDLQQKIFNYSQYNSHLNDSSDQLESIGESNPINSKSITSTTEGNGCSLNPTPNNKLDSDFVEKSEAAFVNGMEFVDPQGIASSSPFLESGSLVSLRNTEFIRIKVESKDESDTFTTPRNAFSSLHSPSGRLNGNSVKSKEPEHVTILDSANSPDPPSNLSCGHAKFVPNKQNTYKNQYHVLQEVSDDTSMVAYHLIGRMLEEYARIDGLNLDLSDELYLRGNSSILEDSKDTKEKQTSSTEHLDGLDIVRVVEELIPSFSESGKERLNELMSLF